MATQPTRHPARPTPDTLRQWYVIEHLTIAQIAEQIGVAPQTIHNWLIAASIPRRAASATLRDDLHDQTIRHLYVRERLSAAEIGARLGCATSTVLRRLERSGIPRRAARPRTHQRPSDDALRHMYLASGLSLREIANLRSVTPQAVRSWLIAAGIPRRPSGAPPCGIDEDTLVRDYTDGCSALDLADQHGCCTATIYRRLAAAGIPRRQISPAVSRQDLIDAADAQMTINQMAAAHGVSTSAIYRSLKRDSLPVPTDTTKA